MRWDTYASFILVPSYGCDVKVHVLVMAYYPPILACGGITNCQILSSNFEELYFHHQSLEMKSERRHFNANDRIDNFFWQMSIFKQLNQKMYICRPVATEGAWRRALPPRNYFAPLGFHLWRWHSHLTHYMLMDPQSIYEMPSVSRCLVFVMLSIAALGTDRPQRRSMTMARLANLVDLTFEKRRTAALDLTEFLRFFAQRHTRLQLFCVTIKLSIDICFQELRPPCISPPWWWPLATGLVGCMPRLQWRRAVRRRWQLSEHRSNILFVLSLAEWPDFLLWCYFFKSCPKPRRKCVE